MDPTALLSGWGRNPVSSARLFHPETPKEIEDFIASGPKRGAVARGLGRSYGDAAQNAGGTVICTDRLDQILAFDGEQATARVQAGVSLDRLMRAALPLGLWPTVSPGTRQVTVGGAIASDIHGKNHHRDGTFCAHVDSFTLVTPGRGTIEVDRDSDPEVFWATAGGMGLTGLVVEATLNLTRVETAYVKVDTERLPDLDALMSRMAATDSDYRYSVAWIDCLAQRGSLGRSILEQGDHALQSELSPRQRRRPLDFRAAPMLTAPPWVPSGLLNQLSMKVFNELWYRKAPARRQGHLVPLAAYFHPLDAVAEWNRIYGRHGFLQYQFVVPDGAEDSVRQVVEALAGHGCAGLLAVLKRFGPANPGPLSFPTTGWTLAVDLPTRPRGAAGEDLGRLLDRFDHVVVAAGGRVYLSKDSRLDPELLPSMYPRLAHWRTVRDGLDPERVLCSDMARRLWTLVDEHAAP